MVAAMGSVLRRIGGARRMFCAVSEQKVAANGAMLHVATSGTQGPALICMPGAMGTAETDFGPQLRSLCDAFQVVSFDPRGYGQSRPPRRTFPTDFYQRDADDAAAIMDALGHKSYNVMGWSDGAISAVLLAAAKKQATEKLVIFGGNAYMSASDLEAFEATRDIASWSQRMRDTHLPVYGDELQPMWSDAIDAWGRIVKEQGGDICMKQAKSLTCPTLVLHGAKATVHVAPFTDGGLDVICLSEHPQWFSENIPGARMHVFENGKHNLHLRFADEVNAMVKAFLLEGK